AAGFGNLQHSDDTGAPASLPRAARGEAAAGDARLRGGDSDGEAEESAASAHDGGRGDLGPRDHRDRGVSAAHLLMSQAYQALRQRSAWLDLDARGRIVALGRDRARLLHNLSSNDVKKMAPGDSCYAFLLNPQGRIQADLWLVCLADHFLIDTEPE